MAGIGAASGDRVKLKRAGAHSDWLAIVRYFAGLLPRATGSHLQPDAGRRIELRDRPSLGRDAERQADHRNLAGATLAPLWHQAEGALDRRALWQRLHGRGFS